MKLDLPRTADPVMRVIFKTPAGDIEVDQVQGGDYLLDQEMPEGVCDDDVEVVYVGIDSQNRPNGDPVVLKAAVAKPDPITDPACPVFRYGTRTGSPPDYEMPLETLGEKAK